MSDPSGGAGCVKELKISLAGATVAEPWYGKTKRDTKHQNPKSNVSFLALVEDDNHVLQPDVPVTITVSVEDNSGGHMHTEHPRPKGKLVLSGNIANIANGTSTLKGKTDSNGVLGFEFGAEEAAGVHKLTATCTQCRAPAKATVETRIPGLLSMGEDGTKGATYLLKGGKESHPDNHYFTPDAFIKIWSITRKYFDEYDEVLLINDSSLKKGGLYDLNNNWAAPSHVGHRIGIVVDINNFSVKDPDFEKFAEKVLNVKAVWESAKTATTGQAHYHLWLLGKDG